MRRAVAVLAAAAGLALASPAAAFDHFNNFNLSGTAAAGAQPGAPLDAANSIVATMGTTLDVAKAATAVIVIPGVPYESKAQPVSPGVGVVKVPFSVMCGPNATGAVKVNLVVAKMYDSANKEILSAQSPQNVSLTFTCPATAPAGKPDLVITSFGLESWGTCAPGQWVYRFSVGVKNQGTASWSGAEPAVVVKDMHPGVLDAWGTGVGIDPPLKPGETRGMKVDVAYYAANPAHMTSAAPHPFRASVNDNHVVAESDFTNNLGPGPVTWNGIKVIQMGAPQNCTGAKPGISSGPAVPGRLPPVATPVPTPAPPR